MLWFKKKSHKAEELDRLEMEVNVKVAQHQKNASKVVAKTKKTADNFNRVIKQNHFTITIQAAAGGKR